MLNFKKSIFHLSELINLSSKLQGQSLFTNIFNSLIASLLN